MSDPILLDWDTERELNRLPEHKVKYVLRGLLISLIKKGIYTKEEVIDLINE